VRTIRRVALAFLLPALAACAVFLLSARSRGVRTREHGPSPSAPDPRELDASGRTPAESRAVAAALEALSRDKKAPALRVASDGDAAPSDARGDLAAVYDEYHPYFVRGDLDGDGRLDFAQAFVDTGRSGAWFHVGVFFGRADGGFEPPVWVERAVSLSNGDLSVERSLVIVIPDLGLDEARRWRFDRATRTFVDAEEAAAPVPESGDEVTPDEAPRVRI
jgi:hypothetical protein